ncbi:MAG TPA: MlaD family protein [Solirubrobacterales bacterium]|nr:MlaD family protein [Solirubrobacterales bacterium]
MRTGESRKRLPNWAIGLILVFFLVLASLYAFTKSVPWSNPYTVQAVFESAGNIRPNSPVRIAGVNVGKVTAIEHVEPENADDLTAQVSSDDATVAGGNEVPSTATVVTMELEESALPLKTDATMKLRPRLFLEGNLFVDLKPGTPNAEEADDGYVFPVGQTAIAVQIDQIFTTLQADVRSNLQILLDELGRAFKSGGAEGFREIYKSSPGAFRYTAEVNEAVLGQEEHDLSELIVNLDTTIEALNQGEDLQDLVTNLRTVLGSFAAESESLEQAIAILPDVLREGEPALASINQSLPALRAFSREALPGVRSTPETLDAATPLLAQVRGLVSEDELRGLTADLRPTIPRLAELTKKTIPFLDQARALSSCFNEVILPWSNQTINDPENEAAGRVFEELGYGLVGLSGESRSNDANGPYIRVGAGSGANGVTIPGVNGGEDSIGTAPAPLVGAIPAIEDSAKTPFRPDVRCETQEPPDLEATNVDISDLNVGDLGDLLPLPSPSGDQLDALADAQKLMDEAEDAKGKRGLSLMEDARMTAALALAEAVGAEIPEERYSP